MEAVRPGILIVTPWDQDTGGVASVTGNLATLLRERGHPVVFLHQDENPGLTPTRTRWHFHGYRLNLRSPVVPGRPVRAPASFVAHAPATFARLRSILRRHNISIVNIHYPLDSHVSVAWLRRLMNVKLVTSVHGSDLLTTGRPRPHYNFALREVLETSDVVIAPSQAYARIIAATFPRIADRCTHIHNGIDVNELNIETCAPSLVKTPYVLCIATMGPWKGVDVVVNGFARAAAAFPDLRLALVGDGPEAPALRALAASHGIADRVEFLGEQPRSHTVTLLRDCELLALGSRAESFGLVLAEAMACGKPVVATAVGGIPEIVDDGKNGYLVASEDVGGFGDAMSRILGDKQLREAMGNAGREKVQRAFLREHTAQNYALLIDRLTTPA